MIKNTLDLTKISKKNNFKYYVYPELIEKINSQNYFEEYLYFINILNSSQKLVFYSDKSHHILYSQNENIRYYNKDLEPILHISGVTSNFYYELKSSGFSLGFNNIIEFPPFIFEDEKIILKLENLNNNIKKITFNHLLKRKQNFIKNFIFDYNSNIININFSRSIIKNIKFTFSGNFIELNLVSVYKNHFKILNHNVNDLEYESLRDTLKPSLDLHSLMYDESVKYMSKEQFNYNLLFIHKIINLFQKINFNNIHSSLFELKNIFKAIYVEEKVNKFINTQKTIFDKGDNIIIKKCLNEKIFHNINNLKNQFILFIN